MDVEQAGITGRTERLDAQAAGFLTRRLHDLAECLLHRALLSRARMKPREDEQFHASSSIGSLTESVPRLLRPAACASHVVEIGYAPGSAKATNARDNL